MIPRFSLPFWLLTCRPRMTWARLRYSRRMAKLHREHLCLRRRRHLDHMAMLAESISGYELRDPQATEWMVAAELLRAAAATEYGQVLSDLALAGDRTLRDAGVKQRDTWDTLWAGLALACGDHGDRAGFYRELGGLTSGAAGTGVFAELAATEISAAGCARTAAMAMLIRPVKARS